mgnify:CR=1 FL=1
MAKITYVSSAGCERIVEVPTGTNVMDGALRNDIEGIIGDCAGGCTCSTCHVYVEESWVARLAPPIDIETSMLELAAAPLRPTSRLACQIVVRDDLDGLVVHIPSTQR